jgi:hypothetical protein
LFWVWIGKKENPGVHEKDKSEMGVKALLNCLKSINSFQ